MSVTNHATGIGTCTQSGMTIQSYPSSEMHLGKFPDHTEFQSWTSEQSLLEGEKSHARIAVDQGNRISEIAGWPRHSLVNNGQNFPRLWRIGFDDGGSIEEVLR